MGNLAASARTVSHAPAHDRGRRQAAHKGDTAAHAPAQKAEREVDRLADEALYGGLAAAPLGGFGRSVLRRQVAAGCGCRGTPSCADPLAGAPVSTSVLETLAEPGGALEPSIRAKVELGFLRRLGDVRVHVGPVAARSAADVGAPAWTVGNDVAFARDAYRPGTAAGDWLIEPSRPAGSALAAAPVLTPYLQREAAPIEAGAPDTTACACGGGCPRCASARLQSKLAVRTPDDPLEREADQLGALAADRAAPTPFAGAPTIRRRAAARPLDRAARESVAQVVAEAGRPLDGPTYARMARLTGEDLSTVRIHEGPHAAAATEAAGAAAFTVGTHVVFAPGAYRPGTPAGDHLLAHELAHVGQQRRSGMLFLARSVEDWLQSTPSIQSMEYTELVLKADELQQWVDRQTSSSADRARIEEALEWIRREIARLDAQAVIAGRRPARAKRRARAEAPPAPLPDRRPQILTRLGSVSYTDPAKMRAEYDLIMKWLPRPDLPRTEREILEIERANLAPLLQEERQRAAGQRYAARLQLALTPSQSEQGAELARLARIIEDISADPSNPELFYIYDRGERVPISAAQRDSLRATLRDQLNHARGLMDGRVDYYWGRYQSQREINADYPVISRISGWLGGVTDPGLELARRVMAARGQVIQLRAHIRAGRFREAASMIAGLERNTQIIRAVSRAFYEGYIEGAETAVTVLEITRDVSFAVAASIGAVVAAPFVAGAVAGAGFTGATATGLTIVGTGTVVGTGTGLVRGGSAAAGVVAAGGSADEALAAFRSEGTRGAVEGFLAGAGGSAARALAPALGVGANVGWQAARQIATQAIVNSGAAVIDALASGASIEQAARVGLTAAVLSIPGGAVGGNSQLSRQLLGPLTNSATAYLGAIANGASPDQARRAATVALTTALATGRITEGRQGEDARYYRRGQEVGRSARRTVVSTTAAAMIATATVPALRGGAGSPSVITQPVNARPTATVTTPVAEVTRAPSTVSQAPAPAVEIPAAVTQSARPTTPAGQVSAATPPAASPQAAATAAISATTVIPAIAQPQAGAPGAPALPSATAGATTATPAAAQQQTSVVPNVEAELGITAAQRSAARSAFSGNLTSQANAPLGAVWNRVANPGEAATLTAANSRRLFNNHRNRFWREARRDPAALRIIRDMGGTFPEERNGGAINPNATSIPEINLPDGTRLRISLDHQTERQTAPNLALDPNNLRLSTIRENTVLLRQLHQQDPFINPPPGWTPLP